MIHATSVRRAFLEQIISRYTSEFTQEILLIIATSVRRASLEHITLKYTNKFTQEILIMLASSVKRASLMQIPKGSYYFFLSGKPTIKAS